MIRVAALAAAIVVLGSSTAALQWPEFRGPTGQGHAPGTRAPLEWSESRNVAWKTPVPGSGWSSPVVADGRVWLTTAVEHSAKGSGGLSLRVLAFDAASGREVVNVEAFSIARAGRINPKNSYASPTPVIGTPAPSNDGTKARSDAATRVFVHFGADGTAALTTSGEIVWTTKLQYESQHGSGGSPILYRDLLIVNCDGNGGPGDAFVVALDANTGRIRWKTPRREPADQAYTTPLVIHVGDRDQLISVGAYRAAAYEPATGREIWRVSYGSGFSNVPRPVYGHGLVFITTGFQQAALLAVRPDGSGDVTRSHVAWTLRRAVPYTPSPILVGDELYMVNDTGIATAVDARTGQIIWQHRLEGNYSASPIYAGGRLYFFSEEGLTTVTTPGRTFEQIATNRLEGAILATPAVVDGAFFIRTDTHLYRVVTPE